MGLNIAGVVYQYHGSYRTKAKAVKEAKKLARKGYVVRLMKFEDWERSEHLFDVLPRKYDVFYRKRGKK